MTFDRFLIKEFIKYLILAVACVVTIYLLIDLFEELDYFINRNASVFAVFVYYLYNTPFAVSLLFPVGVILSCFFVYGTLLRDRSLYVFQIAGVNIYRLFAPMFFVSILLIFIQFWSIELITIPANRNLQSYKRNKIEKRQSNVTNKRSNLYVRGKENIVYFIREFETEHINSKTQSATMKNFIIVQYAKEGQLLKRIDADRAYFQDNQWLAINATVRIFNNDSIESFFKYDTFILEIKETPDIFTQETRNIEELNVWELSAYIRQLKFAGVKTAKAEVEYHYRFANSFILCIMILLSLSLTIKLRRGGVMLGLGLGLLFSFVYWGLVQVTKAFGQILLISPFLAAWLVNFLFLVIAIYLLIQVKKYA